VYAAVHLSRAEMNSSAGGFAWKLAALAIYGRNLVDKLLLHFLEHREGEKRRFLSSNFSMRETLFKSTR